MERDRDIQTKREREKGMVSEMVALYCRKQHSTKKGLCADCTVLAAYARQRSDNCPFMETKMFCSNCKVHCDAFFRPKNDSLSSDSSSSPYLGNEKRKKTIGELK